jgi:hypothetical protein
VTLWKELRQLKKRGLAWVPRVLCPSADRDSYFVLRSKIKSAVRNSLGNVIIAMMLPGDPALGILDLLRAQVHGRIETPEMPPSPGPTAHRRDLTIAVTGRAVRASVSLRGTTAWQRWSVRNSRCKWLCSRARLLPGRQAKPWIVQAKNCTALGAEELSRSVGLGAAEVRRACGR